MQLCRIALIKVVCVSAVEAVQNTVVFSSLNFDQTICTDKMSMPVSKATKGDCRGYIQGIKEQAVILVFS